MCPKRSRQDSEARSRATAHGLSFALGLARRQVRKHLVAAIQQGEVVRVWSNCITSSIG